MRAPLPDVFGGGRGVRVLLIGAHPDDETIGAGGLLVALSAAEAEVAVAVATDGAPANMDDAHAHGFRTRVAYSAAREAELRCALGCLPHPPRRFRIALPDQSLSFRLRELTDNVIRIVRECHPSVVLTHPYEGGHPDHDSVALAAAVAVEAAGVPSPPRHLEFTSYHLWNGSARTGAFVDDDRTSLAFELDEDLRRLKARMLECFTTQRETLRGFDPAAAERFRPAPRYDFRRPPHAPPLLYDLYDWGIRSDEWRVRAAGLLDAGSAACR